jgi:hypothetical protein
MSFCADRPKTKKKFDEYILQHKENGEFNKEELINNCNELLGYFPISMVMSNQLYKRLEDNNIPSISKYNFDLQVCWFIPVSFELKRSKNDKDYFVVQVIDDANKENEIKVWSIDKEKDLIYINRPYVAKLNYDENFGGFSCIGVSKNWKMIG